MDEFSEAATTATVAKDIVFPDVHKQNPIMQETTVKQLGDCQISQSAAGHHIALTFRAFRMNIAHDVERKRKREREREREREKKKERERERGLSVRCSEQQRGARSTRREHTAHLEREKSCESPGLRAFAAVK